MTSRSLALLVLLVSALAACQAYDRGRYNGLLDASDRADVADSIDAPADAFDAGRDGANSDTLAPDGDDAMTACASCAANEVCCNDRCVDTRLDRSNCGACGNACPGTTCSGGTCTAVCVICGSCGNRCTSGPNSTAACSIGTCTLSCSAGFANCNTSTTDGCETPLDTLTNCRSCGDVCTAPTGGTASCATGACVVSCPAGQQACGGACVTVTNNVANCGACGRACAAGQSCFNGSCAPTTCAAGSGYANCNASSTDGCEVNTNTDPRNCGTCGHACASGQACVAGTCVACNTTAPQVLVFGSSTVQTYFPTGAMVTLATEAMWRSMTTANFAAYDYIVITSGNTSAAYLAIYETRATWSAAVNGRMVVTGADASVHTTYSATFLRAAFSWLATGPGTGLFVESDVGARSLDFMQSFGPLTVANSSGNAVTLVQPTHPVMAGSTSTSLSTWNQSYHQYFTTIAPFYLPLADAAQSNAQHVHMVRDAQCLP